MTSFTGVHHVALVTKDMDATIRFWRDILGMRLVVTLGRPGYRLYFFEVSQGDLISFFEWPGVEHGVDKDPGVPVKGPVIFDHVAFGISSEDEFWELKKTIAQAGFWVSEVVDHGFIYSFYSFDPNNIPLEFSWNVPGRDVRQHTLFKDKAPCPAALEGSEKQPLQFYSGSQFDEEERIIYPGDGSEYY